MPAVNYKRRARVKLAAPAYKKLIAEVYERDGWRCRSCNRRDGINAHHIKYRSQGGNDEIDNLVSLCVRCHRAVHDGNLKVVIEEGELNFTNKNGWCAE